MDCFESDYVEQVISGEILPPSGYRINDSGDGLIEKTESEILNTDTADITGWAEVATYCTMKIAECERNLTTTDYCVAKMNELSIEGDAEGLEQLREKYSAELASRKEWRATINRLEVKLDELNANRPKIEEAETDKNILPTPCDIEYPKKDAIYI